MTESLVSDKPVTGIRLPLTLTPNEELKKEAASQPMFAVELWQESFLRLLKTGSHWAEVSAKVPTARQRSGKPPGAPLNQLVKDLHEIYRQLEHSVASHRRFCTFLEAVLTPLVPEKYRPKGGFLSIATETRQALEK
jgi:hypothetical protein